MREELRDGPSGPIPAAPGGIGGDLPVSQELREAIESAKSRLPGALPETERPAGSTEATSSVLAEVADEGASPATRPEPTLDLHLTSPPDPAREADPEELSSPTPEREPPLDFHLEPVVTAPAPTSGYIPVELTPASEQPVPAESLTGAIPSSSGVMGLDELRAVAFQPATTPLVPGRRWWRRERAEVHPHPGLVDPEPLAEAPAASVGPAEPERPALSGRERRWLRRRRRIVFEEVLGWILVPVILVASYWLVKFLLASMGTTPTALIEGVKQALQGLDRR